MSEVERLECPKCKYVRQPEDTAPRWQCPRCGIAYEKFLDNPPATVRPVTPVATRNGVGRKAKESGFTFRKLRIAILLLILVAVGLDSWLTLVRSTSWDHPLRVVVYPINGDGSADSEEYIRTLATADFNAVEQFMADEVQRYKLPVKEPLDVRIGPVVNELPPLPPKDRNIWKTMLWSLQLRYWSIVKDEYDGPRPNIRIFVLYHTLEEGKLLDHSTGLQKGMVSVVHAFAAEKMAARNNVVIAHEMLHTLGATDKYDLGNGRPIYPDGYGDPEQQPRHPQQWAEIMGGRIAISETEAEMPKSLKQTLIGAATAREIGWLRGK